MAIDHKIDILLSTYNGGRYLRELLESIFNQSFTDWCLIVRDDGSQDNTLNIVNEYFQKYPHKIMVMPSRQARLGAKASFGKLMEFSRATYVMFCDQDDVWLKEKIQVTFNKFLELEDKFDNSVPALVYTDALLTDEYLNVISGHLQHYLKFDVPQATNFRNAILRNVMVGNTVLFNRSLLKLSCPIPPDAYMHDWWVGLVVAAFGKIGYVPQPTVFYRQHGQNLCGLRKQNLLKSLICFPRDYKKYMPHQEKVHKQIKAFYVRFKKDLLEEKSDMPSEIAMVSHLAYLERLSYWRQKSFLIKFYAGCPYRQKALCDLIFYFKIYK